MLQNCNTTDGFKTRIVILPIDSGYTYKNGSFYERLEREREKVGRSYGEYLFTHKAKNKQIHQQKHKIEINAVNYVR